MAISDDDREDAETATCDTTPLGTPKPPIDRGQLQPGTVLSQRYFAGSLVEAAAIVGVGLVGWRFAGGGSA